MDNVWQKKHYQKETVAIFIQFSMDYCMILDL
jgi:hypothetical protein